jgi:hypothetical protein
MQQLFRLVCHLDRKRVKWVQSHVLEQLAQDDWSLLARQPGGLLAWKQSLLRLQPAILDWLSCLRVSTLPFTRNTLGAKIRGQ